MTQRVPVGLVEEVLDETRRREKRVRLLPALVVVYFVLALTLFSDRGYVGVWCKSISALRRVIVKIPTASALRQARRRLGSAPLKLLFERLRGPAALPGTKGVFHRGLRVVAWDGSSLDVPDSPACGAVFNQRTNQHGNGGYPQVNVALLVECGTRAIIDAAFGTAAEQALVARMVPSLRPGMLLLADRNFTGYQLWCHAAQTGAQLLWRASRRLLLPVDQALPDGSYLSRRGGKNIPRHQQPVLRVITCSITVRLADGTTRSEPYRLVTTLLDHRRHPATELAALYARRWEVETAYLGWKTTQRGSRRVLRSRTPAGIEQEIYAYLITHHLLRDLICQAAEDTGHAPDRLSFTAALHATRDSIVKHTGTIPRHYPHDWDTLRREILDQTTQARRSRTSPRTRKRQRDRYPAPPHTTHPTSQKATYKINIHTPLTTPNTT